MRAFGLLPVAAVALAVAGVASAKGGDLAVRPMGAHGPLVRYDLDHASRRFALPAGMLSADGNRFAAVTLRKLTVFDALAGRALRDASVPLGSRVEAISATGRWIVVRRGASVRVLDGSTGSSAHTTRVMRLPGSIDVDTVSADGQSLYLIRHGAGLRYGVVRYDLVKGRLLPKELVQKGGDEQMAGTPAGIVASPAGDWQYTLYRNSANRTAFVHALQLEYRFTVCLDLPGTGTAAQLHGYTLALSPDRGQLYAANPALGVVAEFSTTALGKPQVVKFNREAAGAAGTAAVSPNGRMLAFSAGSQVWLLDVPFSTVRGPYSADRAVVGLGFAGDRLFAAQADGKLASFDAATGRRS